MSRLRLRSDGTERTWPPRRATRWALIIGCAAGASALTIVYPALGFSLNVGAVTLATLRTLTGDSTPGGHRYDEKR